MAADLIIYALVAAGLVLWLKNILGTRHGDEQERQSPYLKGDDKSDDAPIPLSVSPDDIMSHGIKNPTDPAVAVIAYADNPKGISKIEGEDAKAGLISIAKADRSFDIEKFMSACQDAFVFGVESFAEGDRDTLKDLLEPKVYAAFDSAITAREDAGEIMEAEIQGLREVSVTNAVLNGKMAFITVRFVADEVSVTRSAEGEILGGHPEISHELRDLWVFGRKVNDKDPRWLVHETRDDIEGDNDVLPDVASPKDTQNADVDTTKKAPKKKAPSAKKPAAKKAPAKSTKKTPASKTAKPKSVK